MKKHRSILIMVAILPNLAILINMPVLAKSCLNRQTLKKHRSLHGGNFDKYGCFGKSCQNNIHLTTPKRHCNYKDSGLLKLHLVVFYLFACIHSSCGNMAYSSCGQGHLIEQFKKCWKRDLDWSLPQNT